MKDPINAHTVDRNAEPPITQRGTGEQVQHVPERGPLRRRPDQQLPVENGDAVHAALP